MGKVFTITEGLENMGAMRTGGQGSVYKGKRIGEIITAVKLLPTPIHTESNDDKNFRAFQNEVEKLKKVNEEPNPHVVKILNSGITESGSFPFIEMEYIEGPDLEELLKSPHDPVFTIKDIIKVADQLANALAHCHKVNVKHGDIKSNNVKFNINTGNYILLDFGLAVMSDEQRRTSLRHAGAIEFMAPEQNDGKMLFQTDVYSFGVILYELLAGRVPYELSDNGETARNNVMVSHMETPIPDVMGLRKEHLPSTWPDDKREREMHVPQWILHVLTKCLEKNPENRYSNGVELHEAIMQSSTSAVKGNKDNAGSAGVLQSENERLQMLSLQYQETAVAKERQLASLKDTLSQKDSELNNLKKSQVSTPPPNGSKINISKPAFIAMLLLLGCLVAFAGYSLFSKKNSVTNEISSVSDSSQVADTSSLPVKKDTTSDNEKTIPTEPVTDSSLISDNDDEVSSEDNNNTENANQEPKPTADEDSEDNTPSELADPPATRSKKYTLSVQKAFFHDQPQESTRRNAFLVHWNNAELTALEDRNGFIYVVFFNNEGQITKGWLRKQDLRRIN